MVGSPNPHPQDLMLSSRRCGRLATRRKFGRASARRRNAPYRENGEADEARVLGAMRELVLHRSQIEGCAGRTLLFLANVVPHRFPKAIGALIEVSKHLLYFGWIGDIPSPPQT